MKQKISALMDGELFEDEAGKLLGQVRHGSEARQDWEIYHLIGDVLRQPDHIACDLSAKTYAQIQGEPVVLAPRRTAAKQKVHAIALSAAASLAAVSVVAWMSLQITPESPLRSMEQAALHPASLKIRAKANEYLMAHQEFSSGTGMNGGVHYIRTIAYSPDER